MPPTRLSEEQIRHIEPLVVAYLDHHPSISNTDLRALAAIRYDQATYFFQIPPDLVVKYQPIDIVDVILWRVLRPRFVLQREIKGRATLTP